MSKKQLMVIVGVFLMLFCLLIGCAIFWIVYQANSYNKYTPESVVIAFSEAGYDVSELQPVDKYPGPLTNEDRPIKTGGRFTVQITDTTIEMYVVSYFSGRDAAYVTREINALNRRMGDGYAFAYRRGHIVLAISTFDRDIAQELSHVFLGKSRE